MASKALPKTFVAFIVDRSGSMGSVVNEAIEGHNAQLHEIREKADGQEVEVIRTLFDFPNRIEVSEFMPLEEVPMLNRENYVPEGSTALRDAIGETITKMQTKKLKKKDAVLFVIVTDGQENSSQKFEPSEIKKMITSLEKTGQWTFTYLGANHNVEQAVYDYGINPGNAATYTASSYGTASASATTAATVGTYFATRGSTGGTTTSSTTFYNSVPQVQDLTENAISVGLANNEDGSV